MLVLSRKDQQSIVIGDCIVTVVRIHGQFVRLGVTAPRDKNIRRGELPEKEREHGDE